MPLHVMEQPPRFVALAYRVSDACIYQEDITFPFVHYYNKFLSPTSILECNFHKIKIHGYFLFENFEFRHFRPHYLDVDTIFGDLRRECLGQPFTTCSKKYHI